MSRKDESVRRKRYKKLREAGFTATEATKYKDLTDDRVDRLVCTKLAYEERKRTLFQELNADILECVSTAGDKELSKDIKAVLNSGKDQTD